LKTCPPHQIPQTKTDAIKSADANLFLINSDSTWFHIKRANFELAQIAFRVINYRESAVRFSGLLSACGFISAAAELQTAALIIRAINPIPFSLRARANYQHLTKINKVTDIFQKAMFAYTFHLSPVFFYRLKKGVFDTDRERLSAITFMELSAWIFIFILPL
jgi:hypothetical protein